MYEHNTNGDTRIFRFVFAAGCFENQFTINKRILQGLNFQTVQVGTDDFGYYLGNGSYTGATGQIQSGAYDTWSTYSLVESIGFEHFLHTNAFAIERFSALVKRNQNIVDVNFYSLLAGIKVSAFCLIFAAIFSLAIITFVNEKCQTNCERNDFWNIVNSLMPNNVEKLKLQNGWTRKILILTCGFTILLFTTYYQCNLLQQQMIPKQSAQITFEQIIKNVESKTSTLHFSDLLLDIVAMIDGLRQVLEINPPVLETQNPDIMKEIDRANAVLIAEYIDIMQLLSLLPHEHCAKYAVVDVDAFGAYSATLMLRKERRDLLEPFNVIVAERMHYITDLIEKHQMSEECWNHIYPPNVAEPRFQQLSMYTLSGSFALLFCLSVIAFCVFLCELVAFKFIKNVSSTPKQSFADELDALLMDKLLDNIKEENLDIALFHYYKFRDMLQK
jgi:hypothetical protein